MQIENYFWEDYWNVGIIDKPIEEVLTNPKFLENITIIETPGSYFLADPFWVAGLKPNSFLCEKFLLEDQVGVIVEVMPGKDGSLMITERLTDQTHFSFPSLFKEHGKIYLLPENSENEKLTLFELADPKNKWMLLDESMVDPVIHKWEDTYYLFCTRFDGTENRRLFLYYSDDLKGPWHQHPASPIRNSADGARMAGNIFHVKNKMYRPGQISTTEYGEGIHIFEIAELSRTRYREIPVHKVIAPGESIGIHTINRFGDRTLVDLKSKRLSLLKSFRRLKRKLN